MKTYILWTAAMAAWFAAAGQVFAGHPGYYQSRSQGYAIQQPPMLESNPVIQDSGRYVSGVYRGPWGVPRHVATQREQVHASALDPDRGMVDPGSISYDDRYVRDGYGGCYRQRGYSWTSNGTPHSDINVSHTYSTSRFRTRTDNTRILKEIGGEEE